MSYKYEKELSGNKAIVFEGFEDGIAPSPHKGIANLKSVNISTETGEVMCSFNRTKQSQTAGTGTLTRVDTNTISISGITLLVGTWITILVDSGTGLSGTYYYVSTGKLSATFAQDNSTIVTGINAGTATFSVTSMGNPLQSATETYTYSSIGAILPQTVQALVIGGGGSGGGGTGGGGGGGQYQYDSSHTVTSQAYTITVGVGGVGVTDDDNHTGNTGSSSIFDTMTSVGGGGGGHYLNPSGSAGGNGGNAGGGGGGPGEGSQSADGGTGTQAGGKGFPASGATHYAGGGGGGSTGVGSDGASSSGGNGGNGTANSISGSSTTYSGGGGGSCFDGGGTVGTGGTGGGGNGGKSNTHVAGTAGTANTGGGGGGGKGTGTTPAGGSGVVIISYVTGTMTATGGTITTSGGRTIHTFTTSGTWTVSLSVATIHNQINYRYYILDSNAVVWVHDTFTLTGVDTPVWFAPDISISVGNRVVSGLSVLNGWLSVFLDNVIYWKSTSTLGTAFASGGINLNAITNKNHVCLVGHQGKMYYTDGNFLGSIFPNTSLLTGAANIQTYASYTTTSTTNGVLVSLLSGTYPNVPPASTVRIPATFFTSGTQPTNLTVGTVYYIQWLNTSYPGATTSFNVYTAASGGSAINIALGAVGTQYFNTFNPIYDSTTFVFTPQRLNLPSFETAQCMAELGNILIVGGTGNVLYPWDQINALPSDIIPLPENNTVNMITVNNSVYVFAGQKGSIYITNGASASFVIKVPDYCAGIEGTQSSYIEPYFTWGGATYMRGRVWFSILDQTSTKAGNCGGIWSFVPTQNFFIGQDTGLSLRIENQSSYGTYSGVSPVILRSEVQTAIAPQYWSAWYSSISAPTYGIDFTDTIPTTSAIIETELVPTGTNLDKETFSQIEYKLSSPLASGETVTAKYRQNSTDSFTACSTFLTETATDLSGYVPVNFQKGQWIQLQLSLNPVASSASSFIRLKKLILR